MPAGAPRKEIAQVVIDDRSQKVLEAYTNYKVAWTMARGYPGAFGRIVNSPIVWIPLAVLFVAPFLVPRRRLRILHLDLLVLSAFSVSLACFNAARIDWSVPLVYPLLALPRSDGCCGSACASATVPRSRRGRSSCSCR